LHREDNSKFVLYIEPRLDEKLAEPVDDDLTVKLQAAFERAIAGSANYSEVGAPAQFHPGSGWMGWHTTDSGVESTCRDYLLPNGLITNSLCVHYVRWYRNSIPACDMEKLRTL